MTYNLNERFQPSRSTLAKLECVWSFEGLDIVWGIGDTRKLARLSALQAAHNGEWDTDLDGESAARSMRSSRAPRRMCFDADAPDRAWGTLLEAAW